MGAEEDDVSRKGEPVAEEDGFSWGGMAMGVRTNT